jgi:hypothetical protein
MIPCGCNIHIKKVTEKSIEYNKPAYLSFIDLRKAFDQIILQAIIKILQSKYVPEQMIILINNIYVNNKMEIRNNRELTQLITPEKGIRQGNSLSPLIFNIIMNEIIKSIKGMRGYRMGESMINLVVYADNVVFNAENDNLQRMLFKFNNVCKKFNTVISNQKTKTMVIAKQPIRCKLVNDNEIIEKTSEVNYLGIKLMSDGNTEREVCEQLMKANRITGCLDDCVWRNKYLNKETKVRIYKSVVRPIMTYVCETRPDSMKIKGQTQVAEIKVLRKIIGKTRRDRISNEFIRQTCNIQNIADWITCRRHEWNEHIKRMNPQSIVGQA